MLLLFYPSVCCQIFGLFTCTSLRSQHLIRDSPATVCYDGRWWAWSTCALVGAVVYCAGVPFLAWRLTRNCRTSRQRRRMLLLLTSYRSGLSHFEAVDLLRKLLVTSAVLAVAPGTKLQLWYNGHLHIMSCPSVACPSGAQPISGNTHQSHARSAARGSPLSPRPVVTPW